MAKGRDEGWPSPVFLRCGAMGWDGMGWDVTGAWTASSLRTCNARLCPYADGCIAFSLHGVRDTHDNRDAVNGWGSVWQRTAAYGSVSQHSDTPH